MPRGYEQIQAQSFRSSESQVSQYFVTFTKAHPQGIAVKSRVSKYANGKGSATAYHRTIAQSRQNPGYTNLRTVPRLGTLAMTGSHKIQTGSGSVATVAVAVLQGNWVTFVTETGPSARVSEQTVIGYARKVSGRIKAGR